MSHIITLKSGAKVKFKNLDLLRRACENVSHATVGTMMKDYYNHEIKVDISIKTPAVSRGIGFVKDGDQYVVKYDPYGTGERTQALIDEVSRNYQKLGHLQVYAKYRYTTASEQKGNGVLVTGRQY